MISPEDSKKHDGLGHDTSTHFPQSVLSVKEDSQRPFVIWATMNFALRRKDGQLDKQNILGEKDRRR
uniref:Uncharacterized protein n=1 Tax=Globodera rostochiensis TaxID=31243 RepID=A0A914HI77_GLORO